MLAWYCAVVGAVLDVMLGALFVALLAAVFDVVLGALFVVVGACLVLCCCWCCA